MGTTESRLTEDNNRERLLCTRCRRWSPAAAACPSCGTGFDAETVLEDVRAIDTLPMGPATRNAAFSQTDTTPKGEAFASEPSTLPSQAERTEDEVEPLTSVLPRGKSAVDSSPSIGSSSDPPTRFLRIDKHIELPNGSVIDDYEIGARLGAGAMGVVYSATHLKLGRRVAIKVIAPSMGADPQALARFSREAKALASIGHPNIVDVHSFGTLPDGRSYFAMELLSGEGLDTRLERGRMSLDEALDVIDQIARALEAAHAQGIVHRDLKPSNTFLVRLPRERRAVVKLLDLGLVKLSVADGVEQTASGAIIGTSLYISPEQARGPNVDGRTDIYALGVVAYELVLGLHPFPDARTPIAAVAAHLTEAPPQPRSIWPEIPPALDLLMLAMLAKDPTYRPTLSQVREVIASVRSGVPSVQHAETAPVAAVSDRRHTRVWVAALVALALVIGIAIGASGRDGSPNTAAVRSDAARSAARVEPTDAPASGQKATDVSPRGDLPATEEPAVIPDANIVVPKENDTPKKARSAVPATVNAMPTIDAAQPPAQVDADTTVEAPAPALTSAPPSDASPAATTPSGAERPMRVPQKTTPTTPHSIDRNSTINPFKRESGAQ